MNHPIKAKWALLAFAALALATYLGFHALEGASSQTLYDNQIASCERGNVTRHDLTHGLSNPLRAFAKAAVRVREADAQNTNDPKARADDLKAVHFYAHIQGTVSSFPQVDCRELIQKP